MPERHRRAFLRLIAQTVGAAATFAAFPPSIARAVSLPASRYSGTIEDIQHIVIVMQENRSFDHYFGTLSGVRGFGDRHSLPVAGGKSVWSQSDGEREVAPFHFDTETTSALRTPATPHSFQDAQAAWGQGKLDQWPRFKRPVSMGHYRREDIPFQFALAEAFTICDAYHCSVTTGTDPNRIVFWSGSNFDPERRARGENATDASAEVNNLRCWVEGVYPDPGYVYKGSSFHWPTIPEILEKANISWRIYQDPNDNWNGLMHGCLAFERFRSAKPGDPIYEKGMCHAWLDAFKRDIERDTLPQVSWILPSQLWSEHPSGSSALHGAEFTSQVLDALTSRPDVWGRTTLFLTFDENDGLFDHVPPPAPPSYRADGTMAGRATLDLRGHYLSDPERRYLDAADQVSGTVRPWGLGPRVPMYVISPWSRGGWVNSQVFDHTSIGRFLEKRFGIAVSAISPWHRAVCGDLTSAFDFERPNQTVIPQLPDVANSVVVFAKVTRRPEPKPPDKSEALFQEPGVRGSRALPYELHVDVKIEPSVGTLALVFQNTGQVAAVFHVYDRLHLDRIPRRYTVEAGKAIEDEWEFKGDKGHHNLWVYGPNGFVREFLGTASTEMQSVPEVALKYDVTGGAVELIVTSAGMGDAALSVRANAYRDDGPWTLRIPDGRRVTKRWSVTDCYNWYDFTVVGETIERRFAGRMEIGADGVSDPAI